MKDFKTVLSSIEKYKDLLQDIKSGIYFWRLSDNYFLPSSHLLKSLGYEPSEAFYKYDTWRSIWHIEDASMIDLIRRQAFESLEEEYHLLHRLKNSSGNYDWYKTDALIIYEDNQPIFVIGSTNNYDKFQNRINEVEAEKENYKDYLSATDAGTWFWNVQTNQTIFNEQWANTLGYTLEELLPTTLMTWTNLIHPDDRKSAFQALEDYFNRDMPYYVETRMRHKDGSYVWIADRGKVISYTDDKKPLIMVGTHIIIDDAKKLEFQLRENQFKYKQLVESSYDVIYLIDHNGKCIFVSEAFKHLLGYESTHILNEPFTKIVTDDDVQTIRDFFIKVKSSTSRHELKQFKARDKAGTIKYFKTNAISIRDDQNLFSGMAGTATDITDEVNLKEQLSIERDLFKKTLLSVSDGVISTDSHGLIQIMNPSAQSLTGYKETEAIGKPLKAIYQIEKYQSKHNDPLGLKRMYTQELYLVKKNGKFVPIEENVSPIFDQDGNMDGYVYVFKDISDQLKQAKDIEYLSYHDYLTGLYNRRFMENVLKNFDQHLLLPLGIMMLDVNDLKEMNDQYGHHSGDKLLKVVAKGILDSITEKDLVGRIGGDEFMIVSPNTSKTEMSALKERLVETFNGLKVSNQQVRVALGCAIKEKPNQTISSIQKKADDLMYINKQSLRFNIK
ncbi:MAG: PAS domain S-box protein [Acholeplasma sp.]|nr:PAS domain S-box protein [Acholeplasma sp.]